MEAFSQQKSVVSTGSSYKDPPTVKDPPTLKDLPSSRYNYLSPGSRDPTRAYGTNAQVPTTPPGGKEPYVFGTSGSARQSVNRKDDIVFGTSVSDNRSDYRFDFGLTHPSNKTNTSTNANYTKKALILLISS